ncbi:sulfotransferase family 2 domain-containing protein [Gymnodinialimonas ulvae]|uniref:sulfotransferase family 2 domain-containing protein n=1 Tax=Gymnodinialimonas ulvae TaxID=3126504 RepID=UPI0030B28AB8
MQNRCTLIISHRHKFIFLHCRKVAGSSITALLNRFLGPDDLQIGAWHDSIRLGGAYNRKAIRTLAFENSARSNLIKSIGRSFLSGKKVDLAASINLALKKPYRKVLSNNPPHAPAELVRDFAPDAWRDYYKFCFVRNPYEHAVSDFFWRQSLAKGVDFVEFLKRKQDTTRPDPESVLARPVTNWPIYTIHDEIAVDFIGRFENLSEDLDKALQDIGLDLGESHLPVAKGNTRRQNFSEIYNDETRALVADIYKNELAEFQYKFSDLPT